MKVNILVPDGQEHTFDNPEVAETIKTTFIDGISFETVFYRHHEQVLHIIHEIMPNGYLRITQKGATPRLQPYTNVQYYHKQLSVLPYAIIPGWKWCRHETTIFK